MNKELEDKIRLRAYEIWEREGRSGDPKDHWLRAERELKEGAPEARVAVEDVLPDDAVAAVDSAIR